MRRGASAAASSAARKARGHLPVVTMLGRIGDPDGPTVDEWRLAVKARRAFKDGLDWTNPVDLPAIAAAPPEPQLSRRRRAALEGKPATMTVRRRKI